MAYPLNHTEEFKALVINQAAQDRALKARVIGAAALRLEDEHHELMTSLSGGSVRRLAERNPCLALAALHRVLGW